MVEFQPSKLAVAGSNPVSRFRVVLRTTLIAYGQWLIAGRVGIMWDCNAAQDAQFFPESAQVQGRLTPTLIAYSQWLIAEWFGIVCICNAANVAVFSLKRPGARSANADTNSL